jgi:quinoprotein glucose dehydrogenase
MRKLFRLCAAAILLMLPSLILSQQVQWLHYGGDTGATRFSPLRDIAAENLERLQIAWQWNNGDKPLPEYGTTPGIFETTPLMVDGVLYVTTSYNNIAALDAETGKELWRFDGEAYKLGQVVSASGWQLRGTAFWRDGANLRIFLNARTRLFALDARSGKPVPSFGDNGMVPISEGLPRISDIRHVTQTSPPVVYKDVVILGSQVPDRVTLADPVGYVQGFSARTGKRLWTFSVIPQSANAPGAASWEKQSWRTNGHGNVWAPITLDEARGLIYLPTSTPGSDYYGGGRPGAGLFAESLVCLEAATGKMKWYFQTVHHGIWDWDNPTAPNLVTITVDGRRIDAVAQVTKQGFTYVFDRVTGKPVWPIVERPVPTDSDVPGEKPYPTQPFPTKPSPFVAQGVTLDDANNLTPEIRRMAQDQMRKFRLGPIFTPPSLRGTLQRPSNTGGANWGGAGFDADTGYLFVRGANSLFANRVAINDGSDPVISAEYSSLFVRDPEPASLPGGLPLISPPYAFLVAIDLNRGEIAWKAPLGEGSQAMRNHPLLKGVALPDRLGSPNSRGGPMITASGLVFIGGGDGYFYAFDKRTGKEMWRGKVPYPNTGGPMTYRTQSGRQFIVVATGGGAQNALVAFTLKP